jgi:hypothetical protein
MAPSFRSADAWAALAALLLVPCIDAVNHTTAPFDAAGFLEGVWDLFAVSDDGASQVQHVLNLTLSSDNVTLVGPFSVVAQSSLDVAARCEVAFFADNRSSGAISMMSTLVDLYDDELTFIRCPFHATSVSPHAATSLSPVNSEGLQCSLVLSAHAAGKDAEAVPSIVLQVRKCFKSGVHQPGLISR